MIDFTFLFIVLDFLLTGLVPFPDESILKLTFLHTPTVSIPHPPYHELSHNSSPSHPPVDFWPVSKFVVVSVFLLYHNLSLNHGSNGV